MAEPARIDEVIEYLEAQLAARPRSWIKVRTLPGLAGKKKLSAMLIDALQAALATAEIHHWPRDLRSCLPTDTLFISKSPIRDLGLPFGDERELATFVQRYYRHLEPFARCTSVVREERYPYEDSYLRVDLCFRDYNGDRIVCELEHGTGHYETGSQISRYIEAVEASRGGRQTPPNVRGVVITGQPNADQEAEVARWSRENGVPVDWFYYRMDFDLTRAPADPRLS